MGSKEITGEQLLRARRNGDKSAHPVVIGGEMDARGEDGFSKREAIALQIFVKLLPAQEHFTDRLLETCARQSLRAAEIFLLELANERA